MPTPQMVVRMVKMRRLTPKSPRSATRATTWPAMMGAMEESWPKRG